MSPIQSYKAVSVDGPASRAASTTIVHTIVKGVESYTGPTASNNEVPTGAKISSILIMASFTNLVAISALVHLNVQFLRSGGANITPGAVGGSPLRNQVISTRMFFIGKEQNTNFMWRIKIPEIYQRVRDGDLWKLLYRCDAVFASATQVIYKFYR